MLAKSLLDATRTLRLSLSILVVSLTLLAALTTAPMLYVVLGPLLPLLVVSLFLESGMALVLTASGLSIVRAVVLLVKERLMAEEELFLVPVLVRVVGPFVLPLLRRSLSMRTTRFSLLAVPSSLKRT